jgi:hypothetical protein
MPTSTEITIHHATPAEMDATRRVFKNTLSSWGLICVFKTWTTNYKPAGRLRGSRRRDSGLTDGGGWLLRPCVPADR